MYTSGDLHWGREMDSSTDNYDHVEGAYLRHSCDSWVIGGPEQIRKLIADLEALLKEHEATSPGVVR